MSERLKKALTVLEVTRRTHSELGAMDTEGRYACERLMEAAFKGEDFKPYTARDYELYDSPGQHSATDDLNIAMEEVCEAIAGLTIKEIPGAKELIEEKFFDIEF